MKYSSLQDTDTIVTWDEHMQILHKISELYEEIFAHDGFGEINIIMRFLKRGQKEVIVSCGKQYRYVVDYSPESGRERNLAKRIESLGVMKK